MNYESKKSKAAHICKLDDVFYASTDSKSVVVISDTSIKNNVTTFITHVHSLLNSIKKTIHYTVNITSIEAKLFAIRYSINQAIQIPGVACIIIFMNAIYAVYHIFFFFLIQQFIT